MLGFTRAELEQLELAQLKKLAGYYKLDVGRKPNKEGYVTAIFDALKEPEDASFVVNADGTNVPKYSVRLQRIMDNIKKGNQ